MKSRTLEDWTGKRKTEVITELKQEQKEYSKVNHNCRCEFYVQEEDGVDRVKISVRCDKHKKCTYYGGVLMCKDSGKKSSSSSGGK